MKISLNWLKEYLENIGDTEQLLSRLTSLGLEVDSFTKLKKDTIIDIDMTPNRADCLSVIGVARDLSTIYKKKVLMPKAIKLPKKIQSHIKSVNEKISTSYSILSINNFNNSCKTPKYISDRLTISGVSQINFIVDVLNYVMIEVGQPMHVFDKDKLKGKLSVRFAKTGEKINALDDNEYSLTPQIPVIADNQGPQAIAGVIGSNTSSVDKDSTSIIIESAFFNQNLIRKSSKIYRLQTESSYRFERGVDPLLNNYALGRVLKIIKDSVEINKYELSCISSKSIAPHIGKTISMNLNEFEVLLGNKISKKFIMNALSYLGFNPIIIKNRLKVFVPSYRFDISIAADLIEEVARVYGYDNFSGIQLPLFNSIECSESRGNINYYLDLFSSRGYSEVITFSFLPKDSQNSFLSKNNKINIVNPISEDKSEMRMTMMYGLLKAAKYNISRQNSNIKIYETGKIYKKQKDKRISEHNVLAGLISGVNYESNLKEFQNILNFYDLKGDLISIFPNLSFKKSNMIGYLSSLCQASIKQKNKTVGYCGEPSSKVYREFNIKNKMFYFEISSDLLNLDHNVAYKPISIFPKIQRDLTMLINDDVSGDDIIDAIQRKSFNYMINIKISDIFYSKKEFGDNKKSMTIELIFQDNSRTLLDIDINEQVSLIINYLKDKFNATVRK